MWGAGSGASAAARNVARGPSLLPALRAWQQTRARASGGRDSDGARPPPASAPPEESITSTANAYVKHCVKLRERARYRREQGRLLLVGSTLVRELAGALRLRLRPRIAAFAPAAPSPQQPPHRD